MRRTKGRIGVAPRRVIALRLTIVAATVALLASCGASREVEIRDAVLLVGHATGSAATRPLNASAEPFPGVTYDFETTTATFDAFDVGVFDLAIPYTTLSGVVEVVGNVIGAATVTLTGGPVEELEFSYGSSSPLATEWTVRGRADGRRFEIDLTFDDTREFRSRRN